MALELTVPSVQVDSKSVQQSAHCRFSTQEPPQNFVLVQTTTILQNFPPKAIPCYLAVRIFGERLLEQFFGKYICTVC